MCKYCNKHKNVSEWPKYTVAMQETDLAIEPFTSLTIGVDVNDDIVMVASGDYEAVYYPKFCPECGADLSYRKAKTQLSSLYGKCVTDE